MMKAPIPVLDTYLLKSNDFAREPGAAPNFAAIQAMFDVYTDDEDDRQEARREGAEASDDRRADGVSAVSPLALQREGSASEPE